MVCVQLEAAMRAMSGPASEVQPSSERRVRAYHEVRYRQHLEANDMQMRWRDQLAGVLDGDDGEGGGGRI